MTKKIKTRYTWRPGGAFRGKEPQIIGEALIALYESNGSLPPETVVEEAADPASPLHDCFEWDNSAAAHKHRLWQARMLCRSIRIAIEPDKSEPLFVSVHVEDGAARAYHPARVMVRHIDLWTRVMNLAFERLRSADAALQELEAIELDTRRNTEYHEIRGFVGEALSRAQVAMKAAQ